MSNAPPQASFAVSHSDEPSRTLLAGFSEFGLAGLTAVDYLVDHLELVETGHITADQLPALTPFENGTPRHHTRLYSRDDLDFTVLVGELFVPVWAADPFGEAVLDWTGAHGVEEITVLSGVPIPHGPEEHRTFHVATEEYRARRLDGVDVPPMGKGFFEGVNATLLGRGMDTSLDVGVFVTPAHAQTPDADAALRLLDAVQRAYDLDIDTGPLEAFAEDVREYYEELSERVAAVPDEERSAERMFM